MYIFYKLRRDAFRKKKGTAVKKIFIILFFVLITPNISYADLSLSEDISSVSINLNQRIDLSNLEYDDSPYAGRTNIGHIFIPYLLVQSNPMDLELGGWYKHIYVQYDEDVSPEKVYPYMSAIFHVGANSDFIIGNFENLAPFPNTIYNEFLYFEERPVCAGLKYTLNTKALNIQAYMDWLELDTEEHPEEFITGIIIDHTVSDFFYYKFFNHYHHKGGQLNKDTHPVRIEQDIVASPLIGFKLWKLYLEGEYYLSIFSQNFDPSIYGQAVGGTIGFFTDTLKLSYQCFVNKNYYHQDAHIFYIKRKNILHRIRADYNIYKFRDNIDVQFTVNLYGIDPPGIDMRLFAEIDFSLLELKKTVEE